MNDSDIIKLIEKELNVVLGRDNSKKPGFLLNNANDVIRLNLEECEIKSLDRIIVYLRQLKNLTFLSLTNNDLTNINGLERLKNLITLNLSHNKIYNFSSLYNLKALRNLDLSYNDLSNIDFLENFSELNSLHLGSNEIVDIDSIKSLSHLNELDLSYNNIIDISSVKNLVQLTSFSFHGNNVHDISPLKDLVELRSMGLHTNLIEDISPIKNLKKLKSLYFAGNPIKVIPEWVTEFNLKIRWNEFGSDGYFTFHKNPIKSPPLEIVKKGKEAIKRYFDKITTEGIDYIYEAKLTLVGEGNAGKTSLQKRLLNDKNPLPKKDTRTRGIEITDWQFKKEKNKTHVAHIWDFGGQDVYYPVHRFFLTENSIFVLLASTRQTHHNFDYWIPTIYQFGGKSPIILIQTCHDGNKISWNDLGTYIGNPNFNIIKTLSYPYYEINLINKNEGLKKIKQTIINQITNLPHYGKGVPKSWVPIRNVLIEEAKISSCISLDKFKELCRMSNPDSFKKLADITDCCQFLHDIGVILWYSSIPELKPWIILQPEWAMNAVYKIIDDPEIQERRGNILSNDFNRIWSEHFYEDKHVILKKMLEIFKIAFPKKHKQVDYIIPARLLSMPNEKRWKDDKPFLRLEYRYEFMPRGLVNQISAELSRYIIKDDDVWNNAVNLSSVNEVANCQIEEDFYNRRITVKADGHDGRSLIILVMNALKNITDGYKGVTPEIYVPCTCELCKNLNRPTTFLYTNLLRWSQNKENPKVTCNESGDTLLIDELLYNVGLFNLAKKSQELKIDKKATKLRLFVSYSKHDESYLQDFEDHLVTLKEEGLISFNCREIEFGKEWDKEIKSQIDECDIMICLVSVKFLNTDYIKKIEIAKAIEKNKIIIPIIIKACDWETSVLGKYQAAQRGKVVSLDNNAKLLDKIKAHSEEERAAFWNSIIKELRKKIFK